MASARWRSLDVLRGLALCLMLAQHLAGWTGGDVRGRFIGFDGFIVTDLAAPMFAVGVGAAAYLVGRRTTGGAAWRRVVLRWGEVFAVGVALDIATDGHLDGGGVLPTLAVLGLVVAVLAGRGVRSPWAWWSATAVGAALAVPATSVGTVHGVVPQLWSGRFALPIYLVFAGGGAAVAAHALHRDRHTATAGGATRGEAALPLLRAAGATMAVAAVLAWVDPARFAPDGLWPPARYPGGLAWTAWGLAATFVAWTGVRAVVRMAPLVSAPLARAGQRTLLIFSLQLGVRILLRQLGVLGQLDTWRWGLATWAAIGAGCVLSCLPRPRRRADRTSAPADGPVASTPEVLAQR